MTQKLIHILKKTGIVLVALVVFLAAAIGFVFQFVLTPEKITPKVVSALNENLNAELALNSVELTFFKTFPASNSNSRTDRWSNEWPLHKIRFWIPGRIP